MNIFKASFIICCFLPFMNHALVCKATSCTIATTKEGNMTFERDEKKEVLGKYKETVKQLDEEKKSKMKENFEGDSNALLAIEKASKLTLYIVDEYQIGIMVFFNENNEILLTAAVQLWTRQFESCLNSPLEN